MNFKRLSGKISLLGLGAMAIVALIIASLVLSKEGPTAVGGQFMDALARHDVNKLTELTYIQASDPKEIEAERKRIRDQWDFSVNVAGQHYPFFWRITSSNNATDTTASVSMQITRASADGYDEKYELPLEKVNGKWLVNVGSISRAMFPALPN
jgi:hypothetical protein